MPQLFDSLASHIDSLIGSPKCRLTAPMKSLAHSTVALKLDCAKYHTEANIDLKHPRNTSMHPRNTESWKDPSSSLILRARGQTRTAHKCAGPMPCSNMLAWIQEGLNGNISLPECKEERRGFALRAQETGVVPVPILEKLTLSHIGGMPALLCALGNVGLASTHQVADSLSIVFCQPLGTV